MNYCDSKAISEVVSNQNPSGFVLYSCYAIEVQGRRSAGSSWADICPAGHPQSGMEPGPVSGSVGPGDRPDRACQSGTVYPDSARGFPTELSGESEDR